MINGETTKDKTKIATRFNKYFVNIGPTLTSDIPQDNKSSTTYMENPVLESMVITPFVEEEVQSVKKIFKRQQCWLGCYLLTGN